MAERYYSDDDRERGITREQFQELSPDLQRDYMLDWFERHFEDPVHGTPYNGQEGGYLFVHGGPYDAHDELQSEFAGIVSAELIDEVAEYVEGIDGVVEWAPGAEHADQIDRAAEALAAGDEEPTELPPGQVYLIDNDGAYLVDSDGAYLIDGRVIAGPESGAARPEPDFNRIGAALKSRGQGGLGSDIEQATRRVLQDRIADLEHELAALRPVHGGMGHNQPPPDDQLQPPAIEVVDVAAITVAKVSDELVKSEPDAAAIARQVGWLQRFGHWLAGKGDEMADEFVKSFGKTLGTTTAVSLTGGVLLATVVLVVKAAAAWFQTIIG